MGVEIKSPGMPEVWAKMPQEMYQLLYEEYALLQEVTWDPSSKIRRRFCCI